MSEIQTRTRSLNVLLGVTLVLSAGLGGCLQGYTGPEGAILLPYLDPVALQDLTMNPNPDIWIIDVRSTAEFQAGHIPTALSYPSSEIASRLNDLPLTQYLIVYCQTGGLAQAVITGVLEPNGYTRFMNWGGMDRWPYPLETGP